ncbi:hypothetical protein JVU11DRAFT_10554 [Chiua virens]|nr:hypothetical protein JVU11DRAFT_10554 [Chiua virens]
MHLTLEIQDIPSKLNVAFFLEALQMSGVCNSIMEFKLAGPHLVSGCSSYTGSPDVLVGDDLRPLVAFKRLMDNVLVELASTWPHLEYLLINQSWGWRQTSSEITPDGIIRLLQTCRLLRKLTLAVDARTSVEASPRLDLSRSLFIGIVYSTIDASHLMPAGTLSLMGFLHGGSRRTQAC